MLLHRCPQCLGGFDEYLFQGREEREYDAALCKCLFPAMLTGRLRESKRRTANPADIFQLAARPPVPHARALVAQIQDAADGAGAAGSTYPQPLH